MINVLLYKKYFRRPRLKEVRPVEQYDLKILASTAIAADTDLSFQKRSGIPAHAYIMMNLRRYSSTSSWQSCLIHLNWANDLCSACYNKLNPALSVRLRSFGTLLL
uniref:Uncharacterized protein n=1 Tax=Agrobacterium tumefaciens TaxID=358 RepID=A0A5B9T3R3_AGRTU|nr:hypothetical protein AgrTiT37_00002 [Agrobacterium tumefaciens]